MPRISVVMAVFNGERYLREAMESVLGQTFADFEFLVIDDGSTDGTREILHSFADPRIRVLTNEGNLGLAASLNRGLRAARGEFIARQDADDISEPQRFEKQVAFLVAHREVALVGTQATIIDSHGATVGKIQLPGRPLEVRWALFFHCPFVHSAVMLRRAPVLETVGYYDPVFTYSMDYDLWRRITRRYSAGNIEEYLVRYRVHDTSMTATFGGASAEGRRLRAAEIARRLGWKEREGEASESRREAMTALNFGWELRAGAADLRQAVEDVLRLHDAFCSEEGLHPEDIATRDHALRARISANLVMLAGSCRDGDLPARTGLLALAYGLCPRVFLRPRTIARAARVITRGYLFSRPLAAGVSS